MKIFYHIAFFALVLLSSCEKKELPKSVTETESDFYFNALINNVPVSLKPGNNDYYMYSSHRQESNNVYSFIADLKPAGCANCANSLQVRINDFKISQANAAAQIGQSLQTGTYILQGIPAYKVKFKSVYNQTAANYMWNFGDNTTSNEADPVHIFTTPGNYNVSLRINGTNACQQFIKNKENLKDSLSGCEITAQSLSDNVMKFKATPGDSLSNQYLWDFGDGTRSSGVNPVHAYAIAGTYPVSLRMISADRDTSYARYNVATITDPMPCLVNYRILSVSPVPNPLPLSQVLITWTDENGAVYTSDKMPQPADSYFKILSVSDYDNNEKGERTKKIRISFKCTVYNGPLTKLMDSAEAVLCVSYK